MIMLRIIIESIGLIVGSIAAAVALCWVFWTLFKLVRHPEWGPPLVLFILVLAFGGSLRNSEFLRMALMFAVITAALFWVEGRAWRARRAGPRRFSN
jgi:hypothetical protein